MRHGRHLASGGYGQLFAETTAPLSCTGDGAAAAFRAGARLADLEFVQFHPTTLFVGADPRPLLSEAMRGEGARLVDKSGASVAGGAHPLRGSWHKHRDVVRRKLFETMLATGVDHLYLDATGIGEETLEHRFPTILAVCRSYGIDPVHEPIPISPACHYTMGGVWTDLSGRTTVPGLYAVGEVASTGVHGANRLASNSLLEGAVFGRRAASAISAERRRAGIAGVELGTRRVRISSDAHRCRYRIAARLRRASVRQVGVIRDRNGLETYATFVADELSSSSPPRSEEEMETANMFLLAGVLARMASARVESRGAHLRSDYPAPEPAWRARQFETRAPDGALIDVVEELVTKEG